MAITVEIDVAGWTDITAYIPFHGDQEQGIIPFELEKVKESNVAILRFGMDSSAVNPPPGTEIRVRDGALTHFGGYITSREQSRHGAATTMLTSNYACQDYNSIMDRIVVPSYTIDAGDTDSTEIETLRATYLAGIGVTAGTISTIDASMEEIELSGTFRQCMEAICGVVGGATFYIAPTKVLNYGAQAWSVTGTENLSDDLSVADSHPYTNFVARDDESRRINAVYIKGEGVEGWYPDPPGSNYYQAIISDPSITTQTALDNLGAAITGDFGSPLEEQFLTQWNTDVWEYDEVTVRHSDLIVGAPSLWTRRSMMRARTVDGTKLVIDMEFGDHTVESDYLGPSPGTGGGGGMVDHILLSSPYHSDTTEATVSRGAMIIGDSTPLWGALAHPAAAGYALTTTATDTGWDQTPDWSGLHTFGAGWVLSGGTGDLNGLDLILDADGDSYLHASADDVVDIVLATATGELGIWINGSEDFTFTANAFNVPTGSSIYLSQYIIHAGDIDTFLTFEDDRVGLYCGGEAMWIAIEGATDYVNFPNELHASEYIRHSADTDTYLRFQADNITLRAGGVDLLDLVEAAPDYVLFGAQADLNGHDLILDADADSYLHASADDVVDLILATASGEFAIHVNGAQDFRFVANAFVAETGSNVDLNGNDLILDADADSHLHAPADDQAEIVLAGNAQYNFGATALTITDTGGVDRLWLRTHGDVVGTGADIYAHVQLGIAADNSIWAFIDADASGTDAHFNVAHDVEISSGTSPLFRVTEAPKVFINETANGNQTIGLTINQGTNDDEILTLKSPTDVNHGGYQTESDTFMYIKKAEAAAGGGAIDCYKDSAGIAGAAALFRGYLDENVDTTKTTAGRGIVEVSGFQTSAGSQQNTVADGNVVVFRTQRGAAAVSIAIWDEDGDYYYDGALNNYDAEDDALAVRDLQRGLTGRWAEALQYNQERLQEMGVLGKGDGDPLVSTKGLAALMAGAIGQLYERCQQYEQALIALGALPEGEL